jgi:uncharacterized protein YcbX
MRGRLAAIYRHPVKGFTPEQLKEAELTAGAYFPCDRIYAVEDGPTPFDAAAPAFVAKHAFAVLAKLPEMAGARTRYDEASATLTVEAAGHPSLSARLDRPEGRQAFERWLTRLLGGKASGPLKVVSAPGHHFTDNPRGFVSILNLESLRALGERIGRDVEPLRFRANLHVEAWPAWAENEAVGARVRVGEAELEVLKPIVRCAATEVNPASARRDMDPPRALFEHYGHVLCGVYASVVSGGSVRPGDRAELLAP